MEIEASMSERDGFNFFIIQKCLAPQHYVPVFKSEIKEVNQNFSFLWNKVDLLTSTLCKEEDLREIKIEFFKSAKNGKHKYIGASTFTLYDLRINEKPNYPILNQKNKQQKGTMKFKSVKINKRHTFLEYVFGGCEMSLVVAVDFTLSNGDPKDKDSLHYFDINKNEYLNAI